MDQVVVGVGNPVLRDDGLGKFAIEALADTDVAADIRFAGTTAFLALEMMQGADRAIVIDALDVPDAVPGSIHTYPLNGENSNGDVPALLMHDFSFSDAIDMGGCAYSIPDHIVLMGIVPERVEGGVGLSDTVREQIPILVDRVIEELGETIHRPKP